MSERSAAEWMHLHVATLFTRDADGDLVDVNEAAGAAAPVVVVGHTEDGVEAWFHRSVDASLRAEILEHPALVDDVRLGAPNPQEADFVEHLRERIPSESVWSGPAYRFPGTLPRSAAALSITPGKVGMLQRYFPEWVADAAAGRPISAVLSGAHAAAICASVRGNAAADEGGAITHPDHRGQGLAAKAVAHWAATVREGGREPLYSTTWSNEGFRSVARQLGLIQYGHTLHVG